IMTSNIGSQFILDVVGDNSQYDEMRSRVLTALRAEFRPEFLNRIDDLIIFHALEKSQLQKIVGLQVDRLRKRLSDRKITLKLSEEAVRFLAEVGYDPTYGARPLKRTIQKELETAIAKGILRGDFTDGCVIFTDVENERLTFKKLAGDLISVGT
ncbi:MAG: AAA family ATPase, partial [Cyanobacteria bacterium P01_F01_bin.153]